LIVVCIVGILFALVFAAVAAIHENETTNASGETTEQPFSWDNEGELYCAGIVVNQDFDYNMSDEHIIIYLDDKMIQKECRLDSYEWGYDTENYFPDGRLIPGDQFQITKIDNSHFKIEKIVKDEQTSDDEPTEPELPDRGKQ